MTFYGFMMEALATLAVVLTPGALAVAAMLATEGGRALIRRRAGDGSGALLGAWVVAAVATAGSLYLSEVVRFPPCTLCWYQRIAMYPLVVVLGVALVDRDTRVWRSTLPLVALGLAVAIYHVVIQLRPSLGVVRCQSDAPCTSRWVAVFGFVSIPVLAASAFVLVAVLLGVAAVCRNAPAKGPETAGP